MHRSHPTTLLSAFAALATTITPAAQTSQPTESDSRPSSSGTLAVLNKSGASVSLIDPMTGAVHATLPVGDGPHEAATAPDGRRIVVTNYGQKAPGGSLSVIDVVAQKVLRTITLQRPRPEGEEGPERFLRPHGIAFLPGGTKVAVTCEMQRRVLVVDIDSGTVKAAIPTQASISHMIALGHNAEQVYVANIRDGSLSILSVRDSSFVTKVETGAGAEGLAVHPSRNEVWVTNRAADSISIVDTETNTEIAELDCGRFPIRVAFTPDGERALVSCARSGSVEVWDVATRSLHKSIDMEESPLEKPDSDRLFAGQFKKSPVPVGILIEPSGRFAYIANTQADIVTVLDLDALAIARRIKAGPEPDGMTWIPAHTPK